MNPKENLLIDEHIQIENESGRSNRRPSLEDLDNILDFARVDYGQSIWKGRCDLDQTFFFPTETPSRRSKDNSQTLLESIQPPVKIDVSGLEYPINKHHRRINLDKYSIVPTDQIEDDHENSEKIELIFDKAPQDKIKCPINIQTVRKEYIFQPGKLREAEPIQDFFTKLLEDSDPAPEPIFDFPEFDHPRPLVNYVQIVVLLVLVGGITGASLHLFRKNEIIQSVTTNFSNTISSIRKKLSSVGQSIKKTNIQENSDVLPHVSFATTIPHNFADQQLSRLSPLIIDPVNTTEDDLPIADSEENRKEILPSFIPPDNKVQKSLPIYKYPAPSPKPTPPAPKPMKREVDFMQGDINQKLIISNGPYTFDISKMIGRSIVLEGGKKVHRINERDILKGRIKVVIAKDGHTLHRTDITPYNLSKITVPKRLYNSENTVAVVYTDVYQDNGSISITHRYLASKVIRNKNKM